MRFVDLSATIAPSPPETPESQRTEIAYLDHADGAREIETLLGVGPELLREREGWTRETLTLGTHNATHVDAPWHYNSAIDGEPAETIDKLPLEWFFAPGLLVDATDREDGDALDLDDMARLCERARPGGPRPGDIVLVHTGRDAFIERPEYIALGPGVTAAATGWLVARGVRVMGIDAWGWDRPLHLQAQDALRERRAGIFWEAHQAGLRYCQIERLVNLGQLPPAGFTVACFPLKVARGSAGPARVVAILDDESSEEA